MTKAVILDLGNVIVPVDFRRCHAALSRVCSYPPDDVPKRIRDTGLVERFETGDVSSEDFVQQVSAVLKMKVGPEQFWEIWSSIFALEPLIPETMLESLRRRKKLVLLSNTNAPHFEWIQQRYPLLRHFDSLVLSYKVGALKPMPQIYQEAVRQAGCAPQECFFTDDMLPYVEGARRQGIDAVQFESLPQLERELRARGVEW